jgi:transposase
MRRKHSLTLEERTLIVQEHLENKKTLRQLTEEFDVSKSTICLILKAYREKGSEGLKPSKYYSTEFKHQLVKAHLIDGLTIKEVVDKYQLERRTYLRWVARYNESGIDGLKLKHRGRPTKPKANTPEERIRQLEMENEVLRAFQQECERWDAKR